MALGFVGSSVVKNVMKTRLISTEEEISHTRLKIGKPHDKPVRLIIVVRMFDSPQRVAIGLHERLKHGGWLTRHGIEPTQIREESSDNTPMVFRKPLEPSEKIFCWTHLHYKPTFL
jgi:hypothetical protein